MRRSRLLPRRAALRSGLDLSRCVPRGIEAALLVLSALLLLPAWSAADEVEARPEDLEFFEKRVRPVLVRRCYECHGSDEARRRGGLRLDSRESILRGGETGPAAIPGKVEASLLSEAIGFQSAAIEMPPTGKLPDSEITDLREWIRRGLPFPVTAPTAAGHKGIDLAAGRQHWAFQPLGPATPPDAALAAAAARDVAGVEAPRSVVDLYLRAAQHRQQLTPSPPASPTVQFRRLKFDLLGLPPTPEEHQEFLADPSPDAYQRWVDRWLASPWHGERYGRFWLDLVRYCDVPEQWREGEAKAYLYRDWVVSVLNADLPYGDFLRRQLAADQLSETSPADNAALGFLGLSPTYWKELKLDPAVIKQVVADEWEERIEAIGGTFLGLTLACARCHDHKYDPISMQDYYALAGVLANVRQQDVPVVARELAEPAAAARRRVRELEAELAKLRSQQSPPDEVRQKIAALEAEMQTLRATPSFDVPPAFGVADARLHILPDGPHRTKLEYRSELQDLELQIRGNPSKTGPVVPRRFLSVLAREPERPFRDGSGRRELAEALVTDAAPLTFRVAANRVWMQHFGRGLVTTPSNFGLQTAAPLHLDLLDELARQLVAHDGSLKALHRELVTSTTYRQSSHNQPGQAARDPENRNWWRMNPRRLEVEAWRDALLAVSGDLQLRLGGPPLELTQATNLRRTLYSTVRRRELADLLRLYDFPDPVSHSAVREPTTTPLQQLFVLNSPFLAERSDALARRLLALPDRSLTARVQWTYQELFLRDPTERQRQQCQQFLSGPTASEPPLPAWQQFSHALLGSNEFLFVD